MSSSAESLPDDSRGARPGDAPRRSARRTAVLVMHGIGEQNPYETIDTFARGFARHFVARGARPRLRPERIAHGDWTEVAVHLEFPTPATDRGLQRLSVFEFYWAPYTEGKVTYRGVLGWLIRTAFTPLRYLGDNLQALLAVQRDARLSLVLWLFLREMMRGALLYLPLALLIGVTWLALSRSGGSLLEVWRQLGALLGAERHRAALGGVIVCWVMAAFLGVFLVRELWQRARASDVSTERVSDRIWLLCAAVSFLAFGLAGLLLARVSELDFEAYAGLMLHPRVAGLVFLGLVALFFRRILIGYVGDITVYVAADEKEASYKARSSILTESTAALARLLVGRQYDRVILAGHSLGSVIAYDTINELLSRVWAAPDQTGQGPHPALSRSDLMNLSGLVTFGSPLDKIFYFFREHVTSEQAIRAQILSFLHSFMRGPSGREYGNLQFTYTDPSVAGGEPSAFPVLAEDFRWLNVWSPMDPVSGRLRFYRLDDRDRLCRGYFPRWGIAHLAYWTDRRFYEFVAERLL